MTTVPRQEILVVCLVESSVNLLHEWSEVLIGYISPLLQRIAATGAVKGIKHEFRIGFVSYSDPCVHPNPILARRFFAQPLQLTKELKDDPASLGLGRTASGGRGGMAVLEGYVAVLEMFDALPATRSPLRPQPPNEPQQESASHDPMCYLIHVATAPPNKATRPSWNTNPKLDAVTWASLPSELLKRKIRPSMILMSPVPELLELYDNISRTPEPFWQNILKPRHKLLFSGLPAIPKDNKTVPQKRAATENAEPPQQPPPPPRPRSQEQPVIPPINPAANTTPSAQPNPLSTSPQRPGSVASTQPPSEAQQPQPAQIRPNQLGQNLDPVKLLAFIRTVELECHNKLAAITQARAAGKPQAELDVMQTELNQKAVNRQKLIAIYQQLTRGQQQPVGGLPNLNTAAQTPQQMKLGQVGGQAQQAARPVQAEAPMALSNDVAASGSGQAGQASPRATNANFSATFGGGPNFANKNLFQNLPVSARPGMEAQMQKMLAERTRPPVLAAAPQSQPQALPSQNQGPPAAAQVTPHVGQNQNQNSNPMFENGNGNPTPNMVDMMTPRAAMGVHVRRWQGVLAWPSANPTARKENQIAIALFAQDANLRPESWPSKLLLQPSRITFNMQQIQSWIAELKPSMALISHTPIIGNVEATTQNMRLFRQLRDLIQQKSLLAYCKFDVAGGPPGTGFLTFPMNSPVHGHELLVAMIFVKSPLPAALTVQALPVQAPATDANSSNDAPLSQSMNMGGGGPLSLQNMTPEAKAFLQQQQAAARAAYNQQQLAQQQAQQKALVPNPGPQGVGSAPFNLAQFMQNVQASGDNPMGLGGLNLPQAPALQQVQHRLPSGFNSGQQMGNLQMLQYMNREGQGQ